MDILDDIKYMNKSNKNTQDTANYDFLSECRFYGSIKSKLNVMLVTKFLDGKFADELYRDLKNIEYNTDEESKVRIMGKMIPIPRKQTAYGEPDVHYHFAGSTVSARNWNHDMQNDNENITNDKALDMKVGRMLKKVSVILGNFLNTQFNYSLINNYIDGNNYIGYHADDEKELGRNPIIAGISFGEEREIYFKSMIDGKVVKVKLPHNSLFVMFDPTNKYWKHSIPKTSKHIGQRISLTFRSIG